MTLIIFLIILSVLVLIHEFGHFFAAKKFGIKVEEFGFGFPPRAFSIKKGETVYSINWLPIGGFVKLYGEDEAGGGKISVQSSKFKVQSFPEKNRAFFAKPVGQRVLVVIAGVLMNAILAVILFYAFLFISNFKTEIPLVADYKFFGADQKNISEIIINGVSKDSPAEKIGIAPLSKIVSVNKKFVKDVESVVKIINENRGKKILIEWQNLKTNEIKKAVVVPRVSPPKNQGALGISFFANKTAVLSYDAPLQKTFSGFSHAINLSGYSFEVMAKLIGVAIREKTTAPLDNTVAGPVGIYAIVGDISSIPNIKERILQYLNFVGSLSISLAFLNILPIPALDGGRLFFILIEAATRRKVPQKYENAIHMIGMVILLGLIILITLKDVSKFLR